jgi:hypothetical protein
MVANLSAIMSENFQVLNKYGNGAGEGYEEVYRYSYLFLLFFYLKIRCEEIGGQMQRKGRCKRDILCIHCMSGPEEPELGRGYVTFFPVCVSRYCAM